jgi:hypothetical protein
MGGCGRCDRMFAERVFRGEEEDDDDRSDESAAVADDADVVNEELISSVSHESIVERRGPCRRLFDTRFEETGRWFWAGSFDSPQYTAIYFNTRHPTAVHRDSRTGHVRTKTHQDAGRHASQTLHPSPCATLSSTLPPRFSHRVDTSAHSFDDTSLPSFAHHEQHQIILIHVGIGVGPPPTATINIVVIVVVVVIDSSSSSSSSSVDWGE